MANPSNQRKPIPHKADAGPRKKGLKKGQIHSGSFKKGYDPRRNVLGGWRNRMKIRQIEAEAVQHAEQAIKVFTDVISDRNASDRDRMAAAKELLDRGYGKPVDRVAIKNMGSAVATEGLEGFSTEQLLQGVRDRVKMRAIAGGGGPHVIDLVPDSGDSDEWAKDKGHYPVTEAIERWLKMIERHGTG